MPPQIREQIQLYLLLKLSGAFHTSILKTCYYRKAIANDDVTFMPLYHQEIT